MTELTAIPTKSCYICVMADGLPLFSRRLAVGDSVLVPVRVRADGRHHIEAYVGVRLFGHAIWVRTSDLTGEVMLRSRVAGFRLFGALVQVEAAIPGLRQLVWAPRWAVKRP